MPKYPSELSRSKAVLTINLVLVITEATELGIRRTLYRFEAKTKIYISYEGVDTQIVQDQNRKMHGQRLKFKTYTISGYKTGASVLVITRATQIRLTGNFVNIFMK